MVLQLDGTVLTISPGDLGAYLLTVELGRHKRSCLISENLARDQLASPVFMQLVSEMKAELSKLARRDSES